MSAKRIKDKKFLVSLIVILASLFFLFNASPAFAKEGKNEATSLSFFEPAFSFIEKLTKAFGYDIALAAPVLCDTSNCGATCDLGCSNANPGVTISWPEAPEYSSHFNRPNYLCQYELKVGNKTYLVGSDIYWNIYNGGTGVNSYQTPPGDLSNNTPYSWSINAVYSLYIKCSNDHSGGYYLPFIETPSGSFTTSNCVPSCPAGSVNLNPSSINIGQTSTASAPSGWSSGSFSSSNNSIATVSGSTITGQSQGSALISGSGWTTSNGATNCTLTGAPLTVNSPCTCSAWANQGCGQGGCSATQMYQTRTCNPSGCAAQSQCVANASCGSSCTAYSFLNSSVNPSSVNPSGSYTMSCNYGQAGIDCINVTPPSGSCSWSGWSGTTALFSCTAGSQTGTFTGSCKTVAGTGSKCCVQTNADGTLTVSSSITYYKCSGSSCVVDTSGDTSYPNDPTCGGTCGGDQYCCVPFDNCYVSPHAGCDGRIFDSTNACYSVCPLGGLPDLIPHRSLDQMIDIKNSSGQNVTGPLTPGSQYTFSETINNESDFSAPASKARFCIDNENCQNNASGRVGNEVEVLPAPLGPMQDSNPVNSSAWTVPNNPGLHTITFCANTPRQISESNYDNNCRSKEFTISSCPLPTVPSLNSPANGANLGIAPQTPTFRWTNVTGEDGYWVDLCADSSCNSYTNKGPLSANTTQTTWSSSLSAGTYWWRVYAYNSCGGVHSAIQSFTISSLLPPPPPTNLMSSCNVAGNQVTLSWDAAPGATAYQLRINYTENDGGPGCIDGWLCPGGLDKDVANYPATSYTTTVVPNKPYVWWIHSSNAAGWSNYTSASFFCGSCLIKPNPTSLLFTNTGQNKVLNAIDSVGSVSWSIKPPADPSVASVSPASGSGTTVTSKKKGTTTITATDNGLANCRVNVPVEVIGYSWKEVPPW